MELNITFHFPIIKKAGSFNNGFSIIECEDVGFLFLNSNVSITKAFELIIITVKII